MDFDEAKIYVETITGYKIDKETLKMSREGDLNFYLPWAPIMEAPIITDVKDTEILTTDEDYLYTEDGRIVDLRAGQRPRVWKIEYTPGYTETGAAPEWIKKAVELLMDVELEVEVLESEEVPDYSYTRALESDLREHAPSVMRILEQNRRLV